MGTAHDSQLPRAVSPALAKAAYTIVACVAWSDIFPLATPVRIAIVRSLDVRTVRRTTY